MSSTIVTFKFLVEDKGQLTGDIRRVTLKSPVPLTTLRLAAQDILRWDDIVFHFQDEDGDKVTIASQHELDTAISLAGGNAVRLIVSKPDVAAPAAVAAESATVPSSAPVAVPEQAAAPAPAPEAAAAADAVPAAVPVDILNSAPDATVPENVMVQFSAIAEFFQRMAQQMADFAPRIPVILNEGMRKMSDNMHNNFAPLDVTAAAARGAPDDEPSPEVLQQAGNVIVHRLPESVVHPGIECAHCHKKPITGMRYKCVQCDCDLCQDCVFTPGVHTEGHKFLPVCAPAVGSHFMNSAAEACEGVKARAAPVVQTVKTAVGEAVVNAREKSAEVCERVKQEVSAVKDAVDKKKKNASPPTGSVPAPAPAPRETLTDKEREILQQLNDMGFTDEAQLIPLIKKYKELSRIVERLIH